MKVLYVTGSCLTRNTSANMSHNAFVQGLIENDCDVDIVMAKDSWGEADQGLPVWKEARYYVFRSTSFADKLRNRLRGNPQKQVQSVSSTEKTPYASRTSIKNLKTVIRAIGKRTFYAVFKPDPLYPLEKEWLKEAGHFRSEKRYDLVISNSSPAASHRLVAEWKKRGSIQFDRWVQIWEDPWYHDLYGGHTREVEQEEHRLLQEASEIVYVSPLTLMYQKRYFPDCADKMSCVPLPALQFEEEQGKQENEEFSVGYFGDYYSQTRDLSPFYEAIKRTGYRCYIYGDSDISLEKTDRIEISGRVTLDKLQEIQDKTTVLVHLCNLRGGQIPGKIYHYSVTDKPILFILDGTEEEKKQLYNYFKQYDRYYFCGNEQSEIQTELERICHSEQKNSPVEEFLPINIVKRLL